MKINHFKIKDKLALKHKLQRHNVEEHQNQKKNHQEDLSTTLQTFLQSFQVLINQFASSNILKNVKQSQTVTESIYGHTSSQLNNNQIDPRDRYITIRFQGSQTPQTFQENLEIWVGKLCNLILSTSFNQYQQGRMNYEQAKVFASECFLRNICILVDNHEISANHFKFIDKKMKNQMLPYIKSKYPMNTQRSSNKKLENMIKKIDNSQALQNDFFHDTSVRFHYRENGSYDDLIMQFLNEVNDKVNLIKKRQSDEKQLTNYEEFQILMTKIFQKSYDQAWVNSKIPSADQNFIMTASNNQNNIKNKILNDFLKDENLVETNWKNIAQQPLKQQIQNQKYKQKVQEYTNFAIGRKVQQRGKLYSESQIQNGQIVIKNSTILRLLTKWCDQLWQKFSKQNYYLQKTEALRMIDSDQVNLPYLMVKEQFNKTIFEEKNKILKFMEDLQQLNYEQQLIILKNQLQRKDYFLLQKYEKVTGKFACKAIKNIQNLMVSYLNRLIHGLLSVSQIVYQNILKIVPVWFSPPNLLSFKIGDLLRCKFSSKQLQTIKIFQEIERLNIQDPQKIKIYRIKNRLNLGTKDILINVRFNDSINCQIQLAVNETKSNFSKSSYNFNHYVYELQRSLFGPLSQTCTIWGNLENRSGQFTKMIEMQSSEKQLCMIEMSSCIKQNKPHIFSNYQKPFICSECSKHYYHSNYFVGHIFCRQCSYIKCAPCLIKQKLLTKDKMFFLKDNKLCEKSDFWNKKSQIPNFGIFIFIEKNNQNPILFKSIRYSSKTYLFTKIDKKYSLIKTIQTKKQMKQFFSSCILFDLSQSFGNSCIDIQYEMAVNQFIIPKQMKKLLDNQKDTLILSQQEIEKINLNGFLNAKKQQLQALKYIMFSSGKMKTLNAIPKECKNLTCLNVDMNQIQDFTRVIEFKKLEKLYLCVNWLQQIPQEILKLKNLKQLNLLENSLKSLPDNIDQCKNMVILRIDQNYLQNLPNTFNDLQNLKFFYAKNNKFIQFPQILGSNKKLKILDLSFNKIQKLPLIIKQLQSLKQLDLSQNCIQKLPEKMQKMKNLQECNFQNNKIRSLEQIKYWKSIKKINLEQNLIKSLKFIGNFECYENIEELNISCNKISLLQSDLIKLVNLKHLNMNDLSIKIFPKISNLQYLQSLSLNSCQLETISEQIGNLRRLKKLSIDQNRIAKFPVQLQNLINLKQLTMNNNLLTQIPIQLCKIRGLKFLSLQNQHITSIPNEISNLTKLQHLNLSKNQIISIPDSFGQLQSLIVLKLNSNKISQINRCVFNLLNLKQLDFSSNLIQTLDYNWSSFQKMTKLNLIKNKNKKYPTNLIDLYVRKCKLSYSIQDIQYADSDSIVPMMSNKINITNSQLKQIRYIPIKDTYEYLKSITIINLSYNDLVEFPQFVFDFQSLQCLNLEENQISKIPDKFNKIQQLKQLYLNKNLVVQLPQSIGACTKLLNLSLKCETFRSFPVTMSNLRLKQLDLLGKNIYKMQNLNKVITEKVNIYNQQLNSIPLKIQQIQADMIILDSNNITTLPQSLQNFKHLKYLSMKYFNITQLPNCFKLMNSIQEINLQSNEIQQLNIQFPPSLKIFNIERNRINIWRLKVTQQVQLANLSLKFNKIQQLPVQIGELTHLTHLYLTCNKLKRLPQSIQKLVNLKIFQLQNNLLEALPDQIYGLASLQIFKFSDNKIIQIPSTIQKLTKLRQIQGNKNKIQKIPDQLFNCQNLKIIKFGQNEITQIPSNIKNLKLLDNLFLPFNLITVIPPQIGSAINLTKIQLMQNKLTHIPQTITNLFNLSQLNINKNQIKQLPSQIGKLTKLKMLSAQDNKIQQIPQSIVNCRQLSYLSLANCNISRIPRYLQNLQKFNKYGIEFIGNPLMEVQCYEFIRSKGTLQTEKFIQKWKQSKQQQAKNQQQTRHIQQDIINNSLR